MDPQQRKYIDTVDHKQYLNDINDAYEKADDLAGKPVVFDQASETGPFACYPEGEPEKKTKEAGTVLGALLNFVTEYKP